MTTPPCDSLSSATIDAASPFLIGFSTRKPGEVIGMFTAFKGEGDNLVVSWSKVNQREGDEFNQYAGYCIAHHRFQVKDKRSMPHSLRHDAESFVKHIVAVTAGKINIDVLGCPELSYYTGEFETHPYTRYGLAYDAFVHRLFNKEGYSITDNCAHALIGFAGELGELMDAFKKNAVYGVRLDCENIIEELGDLYFYIRAYDINAQAYSRIDEGLDPSTSKRFGDIINTLPDEMKDFTASTMTIRFNTLLELFSKKACRPVTLEEIIDANYKKLQLRYPEGYTNIAALARADKA